MTKKNSAQYSAAELTALRAAGETATRADAPMRDIDAEFWEKARVVPPGGKVSAHLRK